MYHAVLLYVQTQLQYSEAILIHTYVDQICKVQKLVADPYRSSDY